MFKILLCEVATYLPTYLRNPPTRPLNHSLTHPPTYLPACCLSSSCLLRVRCTRSACSGPIMSSISHPRLLLLTSFCCTADSHFAGYLHDGWSRRIELPHVALEVCLFVVIAKETLTVKCVQAAGYRVLGAIATYLPSFLTHPPAHLSTHSPTHPATHPNC